jgi:hypothetical protein
MFCNSNSLSLGCRTAVTRLGVLGMVEWIAGLKTTAKFEDSVSTVLVVFNVCQCNLNSVTSVYPDALSDKLFTFMIDLSSLYS